MAKDTYKQKMEEVCGGTRPYLNTAHLESEHNQIKDKALLQFKSKRKMGGEEFSKTYQEALDKVCHWEILCISKRHLNYFSLK